MHSLNMLTATLTPHSKHGGLVGRLLQRHDKIETNKKAELACEPLLKRTEAWEISGSLRQGPNRFGRVKVQTKLRWTISTLTLKRWTFDIAGQGRLVFCGKLERNLASEGKVSTTSTIYRENVPNQSAFWSHRGFARFGSHAMMVTCSSDYALRSP